MHVHVLYAYDPAEQELLLRELQPGINVTWGPEIDRPSDVEVLVGGSLKADQLAACPLLRAYMVPWAGPPVAVRQLLASRPEITLHNLHHNAAATAESAITLMMAAAKRTIQRDSHFRRDGWPARTRWDDHVIELNGKTVLILGYGTIGRRIGRTCQALGMKVLGTRRNAAAREIQDGAEVHPATALHELLPRANILINCLPGTEETVGLIGHHELSLLAKPSMAINVGRGAAFKEEEFYRALTDGTLLAAGIDVWWHYMEGAEEDNEDGLPRGSKYPFHELDNVVLTPHRSGMTRETEPKRFKELAVLINAAAEKKEIPNLVPLGRGY